MSVVALGQPKPCDWCGRPAWLANADGPTHLCCARHGAVDPEAPCPACLASAEARRHNGTHVPNDKRSTRIRKAAS